MNGDYSYKASNWSQLHKTLNLTKTEFMSLAGFQYDSFRISIVVTLSIMEPWSRGLITFTSGGKNG